MDIARDQMAPPPEVAVLGRSWVKGIDVRHQGTSFLRIVQIWLFLWFGPKMTRPQDHKTGRAGSLVNLVINAGKFPRQAENVEMLRGDHVRRLLLPRRVGL